MVPMRVAGSGLPMVIYRYFSLLSGIVSGAEKNTLSVDDVCGWSRNISEEMLAAE